MWIWASQHEGFTCLEYAPRSSARQEYSRHSAGYLDDFLLWLGQPYSKNITLTESRKQCIKTIASLQTTNVDFNTNIRPLLNHLMESEGTTFLKLRECEESFPPPKKVLFPKVLFTAVLEIPGWSRNSQSRDPHFTTWTALTRIFSLHKNIHAPRVATLSSK